MVLLVRPCEHSPHKRELNGGPSGITPSAAGICHARGRREKRLCGELAADRPAGTTENSPALQRWVGRFAGKKSRQGRQSRGLGETSFVPAGTRLVSAPNPALKCWAIFCRPPGWGGDIVQPGRTGETPGQRAAGFVKLAYGRFARSGNSPSGTFRLIPPSSRVRCRCGPRAALRQRGRQDSVSLTPPATSPPSPPNPRARSCRAGCPSCRSATSRAGP